MIISEVSEGIDHLTYLWIITSLDDLVSDEVSARIHKAPLAFARLVLLVMSSNQTASLLRNSSLRSTLWMRNKAIKSKRYSQVTDIRS